MVTGKSKEPTILSVLILTHFLLCAIKTTWRTTACSHITQLLAGILILKVFAITAISDTCAPATLTVALRRTQVFGVFAGVRVWNAETFNVRTRFPSKPIVLGILTFTNRFECFVETATRTATGTKCTLVFADSLALPGLTAILYTRVSTTFASARYCAGIHITLIL